MTNLFTLPPAPTLPVDGLSGTYPVRRIFCVGRNYVAHAVEMGGEVDREAPWYFTKSAWHLMQSGGIQPYPPMTSDYHYEMEFVVALNAPVFQADVTAAKAAVFGYACGLDMTRRDLQQIGKDNRRPWDLGKDLENGAVIGPLRQAAQFGDVAQQRIRLTVNDTVRQDATLADMVWSVPEVISHLSHAYHLGPGDLIMTGTPAGVGPVAVGDDLQGTIDGLSPVSLGIGPAA